jgi:flagellar motor switch protein FliM
VHLEKLLEQSEIDAMVRAARGGVAKAEVVVSRFDYREIGMAREQLEAISAIHEGFARNLTNSIGAYLRIGFQAGLASAEHVSYREFIGAVPEKSYLGSVKIEPIGAAALIQMDMAVAFPLIDVLLGGEGIGESPSREITDIEEQILETIMRIICRELQNVWQALDVQFAFEQRQQPGRVQHLLPVEERTLGLSFELSMKNCRGLMSIALPAVVSGALLRKISAGRPKSQTQIGREDAIERLQRRLLRCPFHLELQLNLLTSSAKDLAELVPGEMLALKRRADGLGQLVSEERSIFQAKVARVGNSRAAQVIAAVKNTDGWREYDGKPC